MAPSIIRLTPTLAALVCAMTLGAPVAAVAQPEPSFRATCRDLRASLQRLDMRGDPLVTIEVEGPLTAVQSDGALVYMGLCAPPDPQVLCVTYADHRRKVGDVVVASGSYSQRGPDHILLDPCLHFLPEQSG
jgi:hypothetical protein